MHMQAISLPKVVPVQQMRAPEKNIPQTRAQREQIGRWIQQYVECLKPVPPLSIEELQRHCQQLLSMHRIDPIYLDYIAVVFNGQVWRETLAAVPFSRRLLLLPKCLRVEDKCPAPFDEFGLLCKECGLCSIQDLQREAERLGYAVLTAEGSALVMQIIQTGKIDAIVGVSCLSVLEKAFPYMESAAIPGVAIPLLQSDCKNTTVDLDWVWDVIHLTSDDRTHRLNLDALRQQVDSWFTPDALDHTMGPATSQTEKIAREWLAREGKRWRPFLAVCAYKALAADPRAPLPDSLRKAAVAVECFHKASLVHDDIEDGDARRYGQKTVHEEHGIPVALNVGDLLLGDGYRLIAECEAPASARARMTLAAAQAHRTLCVGQGAELWWARDPQPLSSLAVLDIFRKKTAPAFEVALQLGAACADADEGLAEVFAQYSEALGIAYQIRDDLDDLADTGEGSDLLAMRPALPLALAHERTKGDDRAIVDSLWKRQGTPRAIERVRQIIVDCGAELRCRVLLESYKEQAVRSLAELENASLKGLLRRVIGKIFRVEIKGWCSERQTSDVAGCEAEPEIARG